MVVKNVGPNFCGTFSFSKWAEVKWALADSRTNLRKCDPWKALFHKDYSETAIPVVFLLHLWKPENGVWEVVPRTRESNKTVPQVVMERTNAYRVGVKVDASVLENHLKRVTDDRRSTKKGNPLRNTSYLRRSALITTLVICRNIVSLSEELIKVFTSLISTWLQSWLVVSFLSSQSITCKKGVWQIF